MISVGFSFQLNSPGRYRRFIKRNRIEPPGSLTPPPEDFFVSFPPSPPEEDEESEVKNGFLTGRVLRNSLLGKLLEHRRAYYGFCSTYEQFLISFAFYHLLLFPSSQSEFSTAAKMPQRVGIQRPQN